MYDLPILICVTYTITSFLYNSDNFNAVISLQDHWATRVHIFASVLYFPGHPQALFSPSPLPLPLPLTFSTSWPIFSI